MKTAIDHIKDYTVLTLEQEVTIKHGLKNWLQQKRLPVDPDQEEYHRFRMNWNYVINKLLEELENNVY